MKLHKQLMNVTEYIQDVVSSIAAEAREKGITIDFKSGFSNEINGFDDGNDANSSRLRKGSLLNSRKSKMSLRLSVQLKSINSLTSIGKKTGIKDVFETVSSSLQLLYLYYCPCDVNSIYQLPLLTRESRGIYAC